MDNITFNWFEGNDPPQPVAATLQEDYWLFYTTQVARTSNDQTLLYENSRDFTELATTATLHAGVYNSKLVLGGLTGDDYLINGSTTSDAGRAVSSYVTFRRVNGGNDDKWMTVDKFYLTVSRKDVSKSQIFKTEYFVNGGTVATTLANVEISTGIAAASLKIDVPYDQQQQAHFLDVKVSEVTSAGAYQIHGIRGYGLVTRED